MTSFTRREFIFAGLGVLSLGMKSPKGKIMTVNGLIDASQLGKTLIHEHFIVDFIGADKISFARWDREAVIKKVMPYLLEAKQEGVKTIFDCTPNFLGRDVVLLQRLAKESQVQIVTNTGYYGARENQHLPASAFTETAEQLADRWVKEFENGIENTNVKPGFIKIGVDANEQLSEVHQKLVRAAALTHLRTGLTICSHTGPGKTAFQELEILQQSDVHPSAFVWVHAQAEKDKGLFISAAKRGAWVSLDGIGRGDFDSYVDSLEKLKSEALLHRVLISHDAGWYKPDEPEGEYKGYTNIFKELVPRLVKRGFTENDVDQLLVKNPADAFSIRVRRNR